MYVKIDDLGTYGLRGRHEAIINNSFMEAVYIAY